MWDTPKYKNKLVVVVAVAAMAVVTVAEAVTALMTAGQPSLSSA